MSYELSVSWANGYYRRDYVKGESLGEGQQNAWKLMRAYLETSSPAPVEATITDHKNGQMYSVMIDGKLI
jgi:hypothetical protein